MKKLLLLTSALIALTLLPAQAQFGGPGPKLGGGMDKLFGANQNFSAQTEFQTTLPTGNVIMPGKISFDTGKSRVEMNMADIQGSQVPANVVQQMKSMGMDVMIAVSRPDLKLGYLIYPGLKSYAQMPSPETSGSLNPDDYKVIITDLGKEAAEGHDCAKRKAVVTDKEGNTHEYTVWNASDLKDFPIKIVTSGSGMSVTMLFKNVSFTKPAAAQFEVPTDYTKYADVQTMVQTEAAKKMGAAAPPTAPH
jgi:hypothetical protein